LLYHYILNAKLDLFIIRQQPGLKTNFAHISPQTFFTIVSHTNIKNVLHTKLKHTENVTYNNYKQLQYYINY